MSGRKAGKRGALAGDFGRSDGWKRESLGQLPSVREPRTGE